MRAAASEAAHARCWAATPLFSMKDSTSAAGPTPNAPKCAVHECDRRAYKQFHCCGRSHGALLNQIRAGLYCQYPGCASPVCMDSEGSFRLFCARHLAMGKCSLGDCPRDMHIDVHGELSAFCSEEHQLIAQREWRPFLVRLNEKHALYQSLLRQFNDKWLHEETSTKHRPTKVLAVYQTFNKDLHQRFERYTERIEREHPGQRLNRFAGPGNALRRFHGTSLACRLGQGFDRLCHSPDCAVCSIIKTGFQKQRSGVRTQFLRFGQGIYFSSTSSKAHDYTPGVVKAVFAAQVSAGRAFVAASDMQGLTEPPEGFDSVIAQPGITSGINYDELVVYNNNAAIPMAVLLYVQQ